MIEKRLYREVIINKFQNSGNRIKQKRSKTACLLFVMKKSLPYKEHEVAITLFSLDIIYFSLIPLTATTFVLLKCTTVQMQCTKHWLKR